MTTMNNSNVVFFLGGIDAEMMEVRNLLENQGVDFCEKSLCWWNAKASQYKEEIAENLRNGRQVVLVELEDDLNLGNQVVVVDHHNGNAGRPASILQVLSLLGLVPTRRQELIAANDCGYIPAMLAMGATDEEVSSIRFSDRASQGITPEMEQEAEKALRALEVVNGVTIVRMAHSKTATITDRLFDPNKEQRLLILSEDGEANFFGNGALCALLQGTETGKTAEGWSTYSHFGGWTGGSGLGDPEGNAYWGAKADQKAVQDYVVNYFAK